MARLVLVVAVFSAVLLPLTLMCIRRFSRADRLVARHSTHDLLKAVTQATVVFTTTLTVLVVAMALVVL